MAQSTKLQADIKDVMKRIEKVLKSVEGKQKREILIKAAKPVVIRSRTLAPIGKPRGGVLKGAVSATYSGGNIKSRYWKFNLRRSLRVLPLKRTTNVVIGPVIKRRANAKNYGKTSKTVDAFYAQMIFGSALAFKRRVTGAALNSTKGVIVNEIKRQVKKNIRDEARNQGLN